MPSVYRLPRVCSRFSLASRFALLDTALRNATPSSREAALQPKGVFDADEPVRSHKHAGCKKADGLNYSNLTS
jgi:hypothetical protein